MIRRPCREEWVAREGGGRREEGGGRREGGARRGGRHKLMKREKGRVAKTIREKGAKG